MNDTLEKPVETVESPPPPVQPKAKRPAPPPKPKFNPHVSLSLVERLSHFLPDRTRAPLMTVAATLLALGVINPLLRTAAEETEKTYSAFNIGRPGGMIVGGVLLAILVIQFIEGRFRKWTKEEEGRLFLERLDQSSKPIESVEEDHRLIQDSQIVDEITKEDMLDGLGDGPQFESRIIAVVSGKGGVGKSLLALGLLEDFSRRAPTLLVDFDLHNRGLTSLMLNLFPDHDRGYVIKLLREFLNESELTGLLTAYSRLSEGSTATPRVGQAFHKLKLKYSGVDPQANRVIKALEFASMPQTSVSLIDPLSPSNAYFLPSIPPSGSFLASKKIRDASEDAAFLFFKALSYRARTANGISNLIVDCHGAHDLYTVGLIRAATDLVIVTTPDMGSLEGTRELVQFGRRVTKAGKNQIPRSVLVVNRCIKDDPNARELAQRWNADLTGGVVRVERTDAVEHVSRGYRFGSVASQQMFWSKVENIALRLNSRQPRHWVD